MADLTYKKAFHRLLTLAKRGHQSGAVGATIATHPAREQPWTSADMVHQEALYEIQVDVLDLLLAMAQSMGDAAVAHLTAAMPWAYRVTNANEVKIPALEPKVPHGGT